jgi:hypothetical protein
MPECEQPAPAADRRVDVSGRSLSGISPRRHAMLLIACSRLMARLLIWLPTGYLDHVLA